MPASKLPPEVIAIIEAREGGWSDHANQSADSLDLWWPDVASIANTAEGWKREIDDKHQALDGWKDAATGRDTRGRRVYMAGKRMYAEGEVYWYVISIHEARD